MSYIENSGGVRQRDPRQRDKAYLGWVATLHCLPCLKRGVRKRPVQVAHIKIGYPGEIGWRAFGHSEKAHDWRTAPLCASCHQHGADAQHRNMQGDERAWWERLGIYPPALCAALRAAFEAGESGDRVLRQAVAGAFGGCPAALPGDS